MPWRSTLLGTCPGGIVCDNIQRFSDVFIVILLVDGFLFLVSLLPPLFTWSNKKPDGKKRVIFALVAFITFYLWLAFLSLNSLYCFAFIAHHGPCNGTDLEQPTDLSFPETAPFPATPTPVTPTPVTTTTTTPTLTTTTSANASSLPIPAAFVAFLWSNDNDTCTGSAPLSENDIQLRKISIMNILIVVVLIITFIANIREGKQTVGGILIA